MRFIIDGQLLHFKEMLSVEKMVLIRKLLLFCFAVLVQSDIVFKMQTMLHWIYHKGFRSSDVCFGLTIAQGVLTNSNYTFTNNHLDRLLSQWPTDNGKIHKQIIMNAVQHDGIQLNRHLLHDMLHTKASTPGLGTLATYLSGIDNGLPNRELSDICIAQIFSTKTCVVSSLCLNLITPNDSSKGYHKTHQILYALLLASQSCKFHIIHAVSMRSILINLCSSALEEAKTIANLQFPSFLRDLLLEQSLFCSLAGFTEFYNEELVTSILSWQADLGCFAPDVFDNEKYCSKHMSGLAVAYLGLLMKHYDLYQL